MTAGPDIKSFKDLKVWQKGIQLSKQVYILSREFPKEETYGLTSQLRRACVSIPANIAEGNGRSSSKDYAHFVSIALGSAREVETLLILGKEFGYINAESDLKASMELLDEVCRMLYSLRLKLSPDKSGWNVSN